MTLKRGSEAKLRLGVCPQRRSVDRPGWLAYVLPSRHASHLSEPLTALKRPAKHAEHCVSAVSVHLCDGCAISYPFPQGVHSSHCS